MFIFAASNNPVFDNMDIKQLSKGEIEYNTLYGHI